MKNNQQLSLFAEEDLKQPSITQKDAFLHYMSRMEVDMLEYVLDDENTYNECTKAVFLEKLNETVADFKKKGNDNLIYNIGYCAASSCNLACQGYIFKCNKTKDTFSLIIEEENRKIIDIFECTRFVSIKKEFVFANQSNINIYNEDKVTFKTEVGVFIYFQKIDKALEEIKTILKSPIDLKMTNYWVNNIKDLIYEIDKEERFIKKYYDITEIYRVVISLNKVFPRSSEIEKLLLESIANSLDLKDMKSMQQWGKDYQLKDDYDISNLCTNITYNKKKKTYTANLSDIIIFDLDSDIIKPIFRYYEIKMSIPIEYPF